MVLQPVVFLAVYYTVFLKILQIRMVDTLPVATRDTLAPRVVDLIMSDETRNKISALAMFVALIPWSSIQECISRATGTIFENGNMIKKIAFPSELLPVYLVGYNIVNMCVGFLVFLAAGVITAGIWPSPALLALLPVVLFLQATFMLGMAYLVSTATVFVRDVAQLVPLGMTVWFFFSPIFYFGLQPGAEQYEWLLKINPIFHLMAMYRAIFVFEPRTMALFPWASMGIFAAIAFVLVIAGYKVFVRYKVDFADEL
jgi:ABC-type polysaccharide/polyol phosphate export permease